MAHTKHISASVSKLSKEPGNENAQRDRRVIRTRQQLDSAFVHLLHWRTYGNIRVGDIAKKAGVGRATFYAHYSSKDDLLRSQFNRIVAPMFVVRRDGRCPLDATALFDHVKSIPQIYKALTSGAGSGGGPRVVRGCFEELVRQALAPREEKSRERNSQEVNPSLNILSAIATQFVASTLYSVLECWLASGARETPQDIQLVFSALAGEGLAGIHLGESRH